MVEPAFKIGDIVLHRGKRCVVSGVFESDDSFRYYVDHSGHRWSVLQNNLFPTQQIPVVAEAKFTDCPGIEPGLVVGYLTRKVPT